MLYIVKMTVTPKQGSGWVKWNTFKSESDMYDWEEQMKEEHEAYKFGASPHLDFRQYDKAKVARMDMSQLAGMEVADFVAITRSLMFND